MEIEEIIAKYKDLYSLLHIYIESDEDITEDFISLSEFLQNNNIFKQKSSLLDFFNMILMISNYHFRSPDFFEKISKIFSEFLRDIKMQITNKEMIEFFKYNSTLLIQLIQSKVITIDESSLSYIMEEKCNGLIEMCHFLYSEIKDLIDSEQKQFIEKDIKYLYKTDVDDFLEKIKIGENDSYVCKLIRQDSVEDFITYVTRTNLSLQNKIPKSNYETNRYLIDRQPTLIEYALFFGSIEIFQYLKLNRVELIPDHWLYAIHGKNPEIIHILEENKVHPKDGTFAECLTYSIKCHHNDFANYFRINFF